MMKLTVNHKQGRIFEAKCAHASFTIDPQLISPLEYFAAGIIACSAVDIADMSTKTNNTLENFSLTFDSIRNEEYPKKFNAINFIYSFTSDADTTQARKWILSSLTTYCSTINTLKGAVAMHWSLILNGQTVVDNEIVENFNDICDYPTGGCCA